MRTPFATFTLTLFATAFADAAQVAPAPRPLDATLRSARTSIDAGQAAEALVMLRAARTSATSTIAKARLAFYEGRAHETLGDEQQAIAAYEHAIAVEPSYGAALNNLALLLSRRGDFARAAALLGKAVALEDSRRPLYLNNFAAASEKAGNIEAARRAYVQLAAAQPDNVDAQLHAIRLLDDPRRMAVQLKKLAGRGEVSAAQSLALDLLAGPFDAAGKRALLGVVAGTLAAQHIDPRRFASLPVFTRLEALRGDPLIADGIAELVLLYRGTFDPARYRWWRSPAPDARFAALIRDIGQTCAAAKFTPRAEAYFKLALEYSGGTDADALVELADLYYAQKRIDALDALPARFASAGDADHAARYRLNVALGTMYAKLQRWDHAIVRLTAAERAAADYNRAARWEPRIPTDPNTIEHLATAYEQSGDPARAVSIRVDAAAAFVAEGRRTAARALLAPVNADRTTAAGAVVRRQYADVVERLARPAVIETTIEFPESVQVAITLAAPATGSAPPPLGSRISSLIAQYVRADSDEERERTENLLRKLGVSDLEPTTMSRDTGEFVVEGGGEVLRYRYVVRSE